MRKYFWLSLTCAALLASCGGGSSDGEDVGPAPGVQQFPGGVWEGTVGTGVAQRQVVGYIDPGPLGTGGEFYMAREAPGAAGFDAFYGRLNVNVTAVLATGVTYYSVQDGKFASGLTLRGTASNSGKIGRTDGISGNYSDPVQTAAASGAVVPIKLAYSSLNFHPARASLVEGTYRGTGLFGGGWVLTVTPQGQLSGRVGGCLVTGSATPRAADSPLYSMTLNLSGDTTSCEASGTQQSGIAVLRFDAAGVPNGIWVFTRNATGPNNTFTLNGIADPRTTVPPSTTPLSVAGNWQGSFTLPAGVIGDTTVWGSVLPDGGLFFYTNSSLDHNALYGRLIRYENNATNNRFVTANDGVFFNRLLANTGAYNESVLIDGTLQSGNGTSTAGLFSGSFSYPTQPGGFPTRFSVTPDPLYALPSGKVPNAALIIGTYKMAGTGFGGDTTTLTVFADGAITGLTTSGCEVAGKLLGELGSGLNLYRVEAFGYLNSPNAPITCGLSSGPPQSGSASAQFDANGKVIGLRILTAGLSVAGTRAHTVFVGAKQTTP
ncbi:MULTISPECIES: hypothetical protein [unclassified Acidovorax]|uniref:hypothetical protein n=1 Tax=unclassified Acidovorax TaxID=2684926 RepID=UPI000B07B7E4|nr:MULTISPECIES: hypothetical protein [unclassified Acidovorax]